MENSELTESKPQLPKLKVFGILVENFAAAGINPNLALQTYPVNGKILMGFLVPCFWICSTVLFTITDAQTFFEFTQAAFASSFAMLVTLTLLIMVLKVQQMFELISGCDELINASK